MVGLQRQRHCLLLRDVVYESDGVSVRDIGGARSSMVGVASAAAVIAVVSVVVVSSAVVEFVADADTECAGEVVVAAAAVVGEGFGRTGAEASRADLLAGGDPTEAEEAWKRCPGCS